MGVCLLGVSQPKYRGMGDMKEGREGGRKKGRGKTVEEVSRVAIMLPLPFYLIINNN